ncbi:MAG: hypothetical protein DMG30_07235 [Acidobacteria bacterium]|nr:MAG: hypothetical protein DMG30_07235 [Acidobacteriota bacterium]
MSLKFLDSYTPSMQAHLLLIPWPEELHTSCNFALPIALACVGIFSFGMMPAVPSRKTDEEAIRQMVADAI